MAKRTEADVQKEIVENTMIARALPCALNTIDNYHLCTQTPHVSQMGKPLQGGTAYIVGAGPSLDKNIGELRNRQGTVFAVNSSAGALVRAAIPIDVLVCIESIPLGSHIAETKPRLFAWEASIAPDTIAALDCPKCWFTSQSPEQLELCENADVPPICHSGAAITAAASLAYAWGAKRIVLVGVDLSYPSAEAYAQGAGWSGLKLKRVEEDGVQRLVFEGREDRDEVHSNAGISRVPRNRPAYMVPAWGSLDSIGADTKEVPTVGDYLFQLRWFEIQSKGWTDAHLVNATEGGAHVQGWDHLHLENVEDMGPREDPEVIAARTPPPVFDKELLLKRLKEYEDLADAVLDLKPMPPELIRGNGLGETMITPDVLRMKRAGIPAVARIQAGYMAMKRASQIARERLTG